MDTSNLFYDLILLFSKRINSSNTKKLLSICGSAKNVFCGDEEKIFQHTKITKNKLTEILKIDDEIKQTVELEIEFIIQNDIEAIPIYSKKYPSKLKSCIDAPNIIFQKGNINLINKKIISVVGTRNITNYGKQFCKDLIQELQKFNPVIISGLAYGVDVFTHTEAVKNNIQNIGVLAHGLDKVSPVIHKNIAQQMLKNGGLLTEFPSLTIAEKYNFPIRNRIIAGISDATIVVESAEKGGGLITAQLANSYNRDVFALPGRCTDFYSKGCNNLIKNLQATMITEANDIPKMLNWDMSKRTYNEPKLFVTLTIEEEQVYNVLKENEKNHIDDIALKCQMPIYKISQLLLSLELKQIVMPLPGKIFTLKTSL